MIVLDRFLSRRGVRLLLSTAGAALCVLLLLFPHAAAAELTVSPFGGNYTGIQEAVSHAASGDTIVVQSGVYTETVRIDRQLVIRGADTGRGMPVIEPDKRGDVVEISANSCTFTGFVIRNSRLLSGIRVSSDHNTISGNTITANAEGIYLVGGDNNLITGNNITWNTRSGIMLERSGTNQIENNIITGNAVGITLDEYSNKNRISRNNFDNTVNVVSKSITSIWDSGTPVQYRYLGANQASRLGNYWSDYRGKDPNGDGIGSTPYIIQIGANKRAVLAINQNTQDSYPLMDPKEFYPKAGAPSAGVTAAPAVAATTIPVVTRTTEPAPVRDPLLGSRILLAKAGGESSPLLSALVVFGTVALFSVMVITFIRRRESAAGTPAVPDGIADRRFLVAAVYAMAGGVLVVLTIAFMASLALIPPSTPVIMGAWLLCVLCTPLSVSSFFLAHGVLKAQPLPTVATLQGIFSALAVPGFALFMLSVPDQREVYVVGMIIALAVSAALPFWQYRVRQLPGLTGTEDPVPPVLPGPAATPVSPAATRPVSSTTLPGQANAPATQPGQQSYFPRELEGKYTDIRFIGRGGIAWVFSAQRKTDGKKVAVKIPISFDEMTGKCFLNEIKAWETLRHPNIVEVTAVNILPVPYVEMEYVAGSLETVTKPVPVWKAVYIVRGIADALSYAHGLGIIHRDIKPHNILVTDDLTPKITDWGMSKVLATDIHKSSIAGFSLSYAAPEQVSPAEFGRTDVRTDIYQLGVLFYELVTGSIPFGGESIVTVGNAILRDAPLPPSEYTPEAAAVDKIILKCLEKDPQKRYQSAGELLGALTGYLDEDEP